MKLVTNKCLKGVSFFDFYEKNKFQGGEIRMKAWIITAIIIGILVIAGVVVSMTGLTIADGEAGTETIECSGCGNSCSQSRNCGLQTCKAVSGRSCGCGG